MGGVDHDGLAKFLSDRTGRRLGGIGRPENLTDLSHGVLALVNDRDALFASRCVAIFRRRVAGLHPGHEFHDAFPGFASFVRAEFVLQDGQDRAVKFLGLRDAHAMDFESDDVEAGARKYFNDAAGTLIRELEIVRLDQNQRFFDFRLFRKINYPVENAAVAV